MKIGEMKDEEFLEEDFAKKDIGFEEDSPFIDVLKLFSPGTAVRNALDDIMRARMGALIVVDAPGLGRIMEGGFKINCKFSQQKLVELAKMDGAIVLSEDMKNIIYANTLLVPSLRFKSKETGTRHQAGERTAKQLGTITIVVSERKNKITLFWKERSYVLEQSSEVLRKAAETLQILEKQKEAFDELLLHLNILEITNLVTRNDVCNVLQKLEIIDRIASKVRRYLIELGREGVIVSMRLKELTKVLSKKQERVLYDYFGGNSQPVSNVLNLMNFDSLLEINNISRLIFEDGLDGIISSRGTRILSKLSLSEMHIELVVNSFEGIDKIFDASRDSLVVLFREEEFVERLIQNLEDLREKIMSGKKI